jgi:palmitoyltransferase
LNKATYTDSVNQTPYFSGIISGSLLWVVFCWITRLLPRMFFFFFFLIHQLPQTALSIVTQSHAISHLIFALIVGICAYNFFRSITLDPGTCPKPTSDDELKSVNSNFPPGIQ